MPSQKKRENTLIKHNDLFQDSLFFPKKYSFAKYDCAHTNVFVWACVYMCMFMRILTYTCDILTYTYIYTHAHTRIYIYIYTRVYSHMGVCIYICICEYITYICICEYTHIYTHVYLHIHIVYMRITTYGRVYIYMYMWVYHMYMYMWVYAYIQYVYVSIRIYTRVRVRIYMYVYTSVRACIYLKNAIVRVYTNVSILIHNTPQ